MGQCWKMLRITCSWSWIVLFEIISPGVSLPPLYVIQYSTSKIKQPHCPPYQILHCWRTGSSPGPSAVRLSSNTDTPEQ